MSDEEKNGADEATEDECLTALEPSSEAEDEFSPFDEVLEGFLNEPLVKIMGSDGLPMPVDPGQRSDIPPLSTKTLVCMGDYSKFVIRNIFGDVIAEFLPNEVDRSGHGVWRVKKHLAVDRMKLELERFRGWLKSHPEIGPEQQHLLQMDDEILLHHMLSHVGNGNRGILRMNREWVEVYPMRPPCLHYVRQITQFEYNPEIDVVIRLCAARRTTEGTFMSVRDRKMAACDMREPPDLESQKTIDDFDQKKIEQGASREFIPMFAGFGPAGRPANSEAIIYDDKR